MAIYNSPPAAPGKSSIIYRVVAKPNSAFAMIRDDHERYWGTAIAVFLGMVGLGIGIAVITGSLTGLLNAHTGIQLVVVPMAALLGILTIHMVAQWAGGQRNLRKTFVAFFLIEIVYVPFMAVYLAVMVALPTAALEVIVSGYAVVLFPGTIWVIIVAVKAVKVLNGFGTLKALGILVAAFVIQAAWAIPLNLVTRF